MNRKTLFALATGVMLLSMILSACAPERIVETVVVTKEVELAGQKVIQTQIVEVTPVPTKPPTEKPLDKISPQFKNPDTYVVITGAGEPQTLDPHWIYDTSGQAVTSNIYEGLVAFNKTKTDDYVPALATRWESNANKTEWTFWIRSGVKFQKGGTLEPHDIAYTLQRGMLQGRVDGPQSLVYEAFFGPELAMSSIRDFAAAYLGKDSFDQLSAQDLVSVCQTIQGVVVADDQAGTVKLKLTNTVGWLFNLLAQNFMGAVVDQEWMVENGDWDGKCDNWQNWADPQAQDTLLFDQSNGTGPYTLDHWTPNEEIVLTAFEGYWRTEPMWEGVPGGPAQIKRVVIKNISEWGTRLSMFQVGDADYIYVAMPYRPQMEPYAKSICNAAGECQAGNADGYYTLYKDEPQPALTPANLNWRINIEGGNPYIGSGNLDGNGIPPDFFSDIHIRKAFNYCFDFQSMIKDALGGDGIQAQGPIPSGMLGYLEGQPPEYSFDLAKCEEEFKLADVNKDGVTAAEDPDDVWNRGFYITLAYNEGNDARRVASEILKSGIEAVNPKFSISLVAMPWPVMLNQRTRGVLPIYVGGWQEDYHDPNNWAGPFLSPQGYFGRIINISEDISNELYPLVLKGAVEPDLAVRKQIYETLQQKSQDYAINIWMYQPLNQDHLQPWIKGYYYNPSYGQSAYSWIYALSKEGPQ